MIKIDHEKCIKCGRCMASCPFTSLGIVEDKVVRLKGKFCLKCMHCAAQCPVEAITDDGKMAILDFDPKVKFQGNKEEEFPKKLAEHIMMRRSYRRFDERPVDHQLIQDAITLADWAPSAKNQHKTGYVVVEGEEKLQKMMDIIFDYVNESGVSPEIAVEYSNGNNCVMGNAKTMLLAYAPDKIISPETDTAIKLTTIELYLQAKGVGTCWAGYFKRMCNDLDQLKAMLPELPEGYSYYGSLMMGYPKGDEYENIPNRLFRAKVDFV